MRILYIDASMGAAGDMLTSALIELFNDRKKVVDELNSIGIPGVVYSISGKTSSGIAGTHTTVTVNGVTEDEHHEHHHDHEHEQEHHHHHTTLQDISDIINKLNVSDKVKSDAINIYDIIADAESIAHGVPVIDVHFHEVGAMDAIADIVAVCKLINDLAPNKILSSPVCTGFGSVNCAHGKMPVPAPATANIIKDMPVFGGDEEGERLTPTGAAIISYYVTSFVSIPRMTISSIGYGIGTKEFTGGNYVRTFLGEDCSNMTDTVVELSANVDDMTAEEIGFAMMMLYKAGALEVYSTPVTMKKSRPGTLITALCSIDIRSDVITAFFKYTSTIGLREQKYKRHVLDRSTVTRPTPYGDISVKISTGFGVNKEKIEYDDLARIASDNDMSIEEAKRELGIIH